MRLRLLGFLLLGNIFWSLAQPKYDYFLAEAEKCELNGDYSSAMELFRYCLHLSDKPSHAHYKLGNIYLFLRKDSLGLSHIQKAHQLEPNNPWYLESLASHYMRQNEGEMAIKAIEQLVSLQPKRSNALFQLSMLYKSMGRTQEAIQALNRIEILEGMHPSITSEKFSLLLDLDQEAEAFAELEKLCNEFPHEPNYQLLMASKYMQVGNLKKAKSLYDEVAQQDSSNIVLQLHYLDYYKTIQDSLSFQALRDSLLFNPSTTSQVRKTLLADYFYTLQEDSTLTDSFNLLLDRLCTAFPHDPQVYIDKASYLVRQQKPEEEIIQVLETVLDIDPSNEIAKSTLLGMYIKQGHPKEAENICRLGVNHHEQNLLYHFYLGMILIYKEQLQESIQTLQQGLRLRDEDTEPELISGCFEMLGDAYSTLKETKQSYAAYDSALVYMRNNLTCLNNYAYLLSTQNERLDDAEEMSYQTVRSEPMNKTYLDTYAWILFKKEEYDRARSYMERIISPQGDDTAILNDSLIKGIVIEHAGDIYYHCGDVEKALWLWELAQTKEDHSTTGVLPKKIRSKKYHKDKKHENF